MRGIWRSPATPPPADSRPGVTRCGLRHPGAPEATFASATTVPAVSHFPIVDVSAWEVVNPETIGRDAKIWLRPPDAPPHSREHDWLFKPVVVPAHGQPQGEDWAEKIVGALGRLLGVPCADNELAERDGVAGSLSRNVTPDGWNLVLGAILLSSRGPDYEEGQFRPPGRPGHSPRAIVDALASCAAPTTCPGLSAPEAFAGYPVLDAWVANQDRHDQNWAVLRRAAASGDLRLAASFDHASSLGFNELDDRKTRLLRQPGGVAAWAERGRAHRFEHDPRLPRHAIPSLVDTALAALELAGERASTYWFDRLAAVRQADIEAIVARTPRLSDLAATFVLELLDVNRRRLLRDR